MNVRIIIVGLISLGFVAACNKKPDSAAPPPSTATQAMPVSIVAVKPTSVPISVEAVAQTEGASEVEIRPRVGGIIVKKLFEEGQPVKAGQVMFLLDPAPFEIALMQAKAAAAGQGARITQTSRESSRLKELLATQSISQREYDNATSDSSISQAGMMQAQANIKEAQLNLSYTRVVAPTAGIAGRFQFSEGALVQAGTSLLTTIVQVSPIWVRFSLSESELQSLGGHLDASKASEVSLILPDGSEYSQKGKLNFAASQIDASLGTQQLRATFDNSNKKLLPGQFVRARVTTGTRDGVFLVPQTAVQTGDQGKFLFVVNTKNEVTRKPVVVGEWQGRDWIILSGLDPNDKVIVDNLIKLNMMPPGAKVAPHALGTAPALPPSTTNAPANKSTAK
ncbi:MAG: efflux RND transporter periplasmic adaptor subunit [Bdellovibrio sp.]|nr:efflux RND transporter periplasmic adaptor subunit [Methylotenera sp.]